MLKSQRERILLAVTSASGAVETIRRKVALSASKDVKNKVGFTTKMVARDVRRIILKRNRILRRVACTVSGDDRSEVINSIDQIGAVCCKYEAISKGVESGHIPKSTYDYISSSLGRHFILRDGVISSRGPTYYMVRDGMRSHGNPSESKGICQFDVHDFNPVAFFDDMKRQFVELRRCFDDLIKLNTVNVVEAANKGAQVPDTGIEGPSETLNYVYPIDNSRDKSLTWQVVLLMVMDQIKNISLFSLNAHLLISDERLYDQKQALRHFVWVCEKSSFPAMR